MHGHQANQRGRRSTILLLLSIASALVGCAAGEGSSTGFGVGGYPGVDDDSDSTTAADDPDGAPAGSSSGSVLTTSLPPDPAGSESSSSTGFEDPSIGDGESSSGEPGCTGGCAEDCFDGEDNDGDGDLDCEDTECESVTICSCTRATGAFGTHMFCPMLSTWDTADHLCEAAGLHLVSIDSAAQNAWVIEQATLLNGGSWWIGYTDAGVEGTWAWTDGSASVYENWYPGEPSDGIDPEDCAAVPEHGPTTWNDLPCDLLRPFVCEV